MRLIDADVIIRDLTAMKSLYDAIELDGMIKALKKAPTIEAAPVVHGEWVYDSIESVWVRHKCSVCGFSKIMEKRTVHDWSYCPNCGAKMDGKAV